MLLGEIGRHNERSLRMDLAHIFTALSLANAGNFQEFAALLDALPTKAVPAGERRSLRLVHPVAERDPRAPVAVMRPSHR